VTAMLWEFESPHPHQVIIIETNIMKFLKDNYVYMGVTYKCTWIPGQSPRDLSPITQVYGFCFDNIGRLLVQRHDGNPWQIMGGSPEPGETPEQTLTREVDEEVNIDISNIVYLGAQLVENPNGKKSYQIRYAARITKIKPRKADPARGIIRQRKFIDPKVYGHISNWGKIGQAMSDLAIERLQLGD
jgi:8-oxo-dGTP diphosphatase